jgi:hypothetical protein
MTILEPTLYANGAIRVTDHGPRGGGIVVVHIASGLQIDVPYGAEAAIGYIAKDAEIGSPGIAFRELRSYVERWRQRN